MVSSFFGDLWMAGNYLAVLISENATCPLEVRQVKTTAE
jgi:hypothetical protein